MPPNIRCPAGSYHERDGERGVFCRVEQRFITHRHNPKSVVGFCSFAFHACPAWIAECEKDPAVALAQERPRLTNCRECAGTGIEPLKAWEQRNGLLVQVELPCDNCAGTGREVVTK